jgi:hypothetical protein
MIMLFLVTRSSPGTRCVYLRVLSGKQEDVLGHERVAPLAQQLQARQVTPLDGGFQNCGFISAVEVREGNPEAVSLARLGS